MEDSHRLLCEYTNLKTQKGALLGRSARSSLNTYPNVLTNNKFLAIQDSSIVDLISHSLMSLLIL